jgi:hypothetical protein
MLSVNVEQRVNVKFCVKLGKFATETYNLLKIVYGNECLSRTQVFDWFKRFKEGRKETGDDQRPGRPSTSKTDANIEEFGETVRQILHNFSMKKVCSKMVPRLFTPEQKEI